MPANPYAHTTAAANNRAAKAIRLADVLEAHGATPAQAAALDEPHQVITAVLAKTAKPSPTTWALVVKVLEDRAAHRAGALDPFAGLPR